GASCLASTPSGSGGPSSTARSPLVGLPCGWTGRARPGPDHAFARGRCSPSLSPPTSSRLRGGQGYGEVKVTGSSAGPRQSPLEPLYPGDIAFAAAQHQPAAVQEVRRLRGPFVALDADIVDR